MGRGLASALEAGEEATEKTKETVGKLLDKIVPLSLNSYILSRCEVDAKKGAEKMADKISDAAKHKKDKVCSSPAHAH